MGGDPERPAALYRQPDDIGLCLFASQPVDDHGTRAFTSTAVASYRRNPRVRIVGHGKPATEADGFSAGDVASGVNVIVSSTREPWPEAQDRADEIVAAWDGWVAERHRRRRVSGLTALFAEDAAVGSAQCALLDELRDFQPRTLADLVAKARATLPDFGATDPEAAIRVAMGEADGWGEDIGPSLLLDICRLGREA